MLKQQNGKMRKIQEEIAKDSCLVRIARYVTEGWPSRRDQIPADVKPSWSQKEELSMIKEVLKQLHQAHMGIETTKSRARATTF